MGYLGRRIGLSQDQGDSNPGAAGGAVGGGLLDLFTNGYFERQDKIYNDPGRGVLTGLTATGGVISDYTSGSDVYRAHVFTSSGALNVTELGNLPDSVEYLVIGGGGGGSHSFNAGGGGGAGGLRTNLAGHPLAESAFPVSIASYPVVIGAGGAGSGGQGTGGNGTTSVFGPGPITSQGGGAGGGASPYTGIPGGSGGGGGTFPNGGVKAGGLGSKETGTATDAPTQGNPGGTGQHVAGSWEVGGGGGGAGSAGGNGAPGPGASGYGGAGVQVAIAGPTSSTGVGGLNPATNQYQWFAGGGGGAPRGVGGAGSALAVGTANRAGAGEGAPGSSNTIGGDAVASTGSGGGANGWSGLRSGNGGSGVVVVRYQIGQITATAKATGGSISFYNGKTIHTFTNSGDFTVTDGSAVAISYVAVAGGGGGGGKFNEAGGGGGAGGVMTNIPGFMPVTQSAVNISPGAPNKVTVTVGGGGVSPQQTPGIGAQGSHTTLVCSPSSLNITATGGGFGGISYHPGDNPLQNGGDGGSGGGGAEAAGSAGAASPAGQGNAGGTGSGTAGSTENSGGGGGGAGGVGSNAPGNANGGAGGVGKQLPAIFQNPASATSLGTPGPSGTYWIAGGGGGGTTTPGPSGGAGGAGGAGGGGAGGTEPGPSGGSNGLTNTGGGGGSSEGSPGPTGGGFAGGSGIVLIAYPS